MEIQKNMALVLSALRQENGKSLDEFSQELEISRSTLQEYLSGKGNPSLSTVEHLAEKLGLDASILMSGGFSADQFQVLLKLLECAHYKIGRASCRERV